MFFNNTTSEYTELGSIYLGLLRTTETRPFELTHENGDKIKKTLLEDT